jgi:hypothetical protein
MVDPASSLSGHRVKTAAHPSFHVRSVLGWKTRASTSALPVLRILRRVQGASTLIPLLDEKSTRTAQMGWVWFLASVMPCAKVKSTADVDCDPK